MSTRFRNAIGAALIGLAASMSAPSASAAIVTGSWDPALPAAFGEYGWTATINVKVADNCGVGTPEAPTQALTMVNVLGVSFGCNGNALPVVAAFEILTAEVGIYDLNTNVILDVLRFRPSSFDAWWLAEVELGAKGEILFLQTLSPSNVLRSALTYDDGCKYDFRLDLPGANPEFEYRRVANVDRECVGQRRFRAATEPITATRFAVNDNSDWAAVRLATRLEVGQTVFGVPEPGSLALVGLALAAAGLSASRQKRRAA